MSRRAFRDADAYVDVLARHAISIPEWSLLLSTSHGPKPEAKTVLNHDDLLEGDPRGMVGRKESEEALASCLHQGWLRKIDVSELNEIQQTLHTCGLRGPFYGMPPIGDIDFTHQGADRFLRVHGQLFGPDWYSGSGYSRDHGQFIEQMYPNEEKALAVFKELRSATYCVSVTEPHSTGPWCLYWWLQFPEGYCITAVYRSDARTKR